MGNGRSQEELDKVGYRVLGVQPNSPAAIGGLVSFFDFIVAANGVPLRSLDTTFVELIMASEDQNLPLTVYNCKSHSIREVTLTPSRNWPGEGMLGVIIRFDTFHEAEENLCHVLDVEMNSPAELAGLQPATDYLLGTAETVFKNTDVLLNVLEANIEKPIDIYVYNYDTDEVRLIVLMPSLQWGGDGLLGASVAHGYLHGLPKSCCKTIGRSTESTIKIDIEQSPFGLNHSIEAPKYETNTTPFTPEIVKIDNIKSQQSINNVSVQLQLPDQQSGNELNHVNGARASGNQEVVSIADIKTSHTHNNHTEPVSDDGNESPQPRYFFGLFD